MPRFFWVVPAVLILLFAAPAQARPRDDVMAGAYRCSAIGEPRAWLDCFYGAAQPARAQLGLSPAPAAQLRLAASLPPGNATPEDGRLRDAVLAAALHCYAVSEDRPWLDCYYAAAQPARARLGLSPASQAVAGVALAAPAFAARAPEQQFGMAPAKPDGLRTADRVVSRMTSYSFSRYHIFTVSLENGQVWRQISGDTDYAHWPKPAPNYVVTVSHGSFRSFNLQVRDRPGIYKVERVK